jgi:hypothetical protein
MMKTFMTRAVALPAGLLLGAVGLAACSDSPDAAPAPRSASSSGVRAGADTTSASTDAPPVVLTVSADAVLKEDYQTLAQLAASPNVSLIISGKVVQATPVYQDQLAYTKLTVKVTKSSGKVAVGSTIVIYRDGGLIPLSQVKPDLKDDQATKLPASTPANAVVDFQFMGAEQSAVGDEIVAFLHPDPNVGRTGAYQAVSSVHGLLKVDHKTGTYRRLGTEDRPGFQVTTTTTAAEGFTRLRS